MTDPASSAGPVVTMARTGSVDRASTMRCSAAGVVLERRRQPDENQRIVTLRRSPGVDGPVGIVEHRTDVANVGRDPSDEVELGRGEHPHGASACRLVHEVGDGFEPPLLAERVEPRQSLVPHAVGHRPHDAVTCPPGCSLGWPQAEPERRHPLARQEVDVRHQHVERDGRRFGGDHRPEGELGAQHDVRAVRRDRCVDVCGVLAQRPGELLLEQRGEELPRIPCTPSPGTGRARGSGPAGWALPPTAGTWRRSPGRRRSSSPRRER